MKIVHTDNFAGDYPNEKFVTELPYLPQEVLQRIVGIINEASARDAPRYYRVVPDDYKLKPGFEPQRPAAKQQNEPQQRIGPRATW